MKHSWQIKRSRWAKHVGWVGRLANWQTALIGLNTPFRLFTCCSNLGSFLSSCQYISFCLISLHRFQANWAPRPMSPKKRFVKFPCPPASSYKDRNNDCFSFRSICWFFCKITRMAKFVLADIIYGLTKVAFVLGYSHIAQPQCEYQYDKYLRNMKSFNTFGIFVYVW